MYQMKFLVPAIGSSLQTAIITTLESDNQLLCNVFTDFMDQSYN